MRERALRFGRETDALSQTRSDWRASRVFGNRPVAVVVAVVLGTLLVAVVVARRHQPVADLTGPVVAVFTRSGGEPWQYRCVATLVGSGVALTAGHCVIRFQADEVGLAASPASADVQPAQRLRVHPSYRNAAPAPNAPYRDLALIDFDSGTASVAITTSHDVAAPSAGVVHAWSNAPDLTRRDVTVLACGAPGPGALCLRPPGTPTAPLCAGDSGAPVLNHASGAPVVVGVLSRGDGCQDPTITHIASTVDGTDRWLNDQLPPTP